MGQQQLLLIILGVIVVGIAVAVGITMFNDSATSANRDAVTNDLVNLASRAQQYYRRPTALGGGGGSFTGLTIKHLTKTNGSSMINGNGEYTVQAKFQGKSSSTTFTESKLIEKLNVTAFNITRMTNSTLDFGTARMGVRVIFMSSSNQSQMAIATDKLDIEITGGGGTSNYTGNVANMMQLNVNY